MSTYTNTVRLNTHHYFIGTKLLYQGKLAELVTDSMDIL